MHFFSTEHSIQSVGRERPYHNRKSQEKESNRLQKCSRHTVFYPILSHRFPRLHCNPLFDTLHDVSTSKAYESAWVSAANPCKLPLPSPCVIDMIGSIHKKLCQIFNNALCFSLYWPYVFFVFVSELMIVRPNYSSISPTLDEGILWSFNDTMMQCFALNIFEHMCQWFLWLGLFQIRRST